MTSTSPKSNSKNGRSLEKTLTVPLNQDDTLLPSHGRLH